MNILTKQMVAGIVADYYPAIGEQSQLKNIEDYLMNGYSISGLEALKLFGAYRLSSIIRRLRDKHGDDNITTTIVKIPGSRFARYRFTTNYLKTLQ